MIDLTENENKSTQSSLGDSNSNSSNHIPEPRSILLELQEVDELPPRFNSKNEVVFVQPGTGLEMDEGFFSQDDDLVMEIPSPSMTDPDYFEKMVGKRQKVFRDA